MDCLETLREEAEERDRLAECEASMQEADNFLMALDAIPTILITNNQEQDRNGTDTVSLLLTSANLQSGVRTRSQTRASRLQEIHRDQRLWTGQEQQANTDQGLETGREQMDRESLSWQEPTDDGEREVPQRVITNGNMETMNTELIDNDATSGNEIGLANALQSWIPTMIIPYLPGTGDKLKKLAAEYGIRTRFAYPGRLNDIFTAFRGRTHSSKTRDSVYCLNCSCGIQYVGESRRNLKVGLAEHVRNSSKSTFTSHLLNNPTEHIPVFKDTMVIAREMNTFKRKMLESLSIRYKKNKNM